MKQDISHGMSRRVSHMPSSAKDTEKPFFPQGLLCQNNSLLWLLSLLLSSVHFLISSLLFVTSHSVLFSSPDINHYLLWLLVPPFILYLRSMQQRIHMQPQRLISLIRYRKGKGYNCVHLGVTKCAAETHFQYSTYLFSPPFLSPLPFSFAPISLRHHQVRQHVCTLIYSWWKAWLNRLTQG